MSVLMVDCDYVRRVRRALRRPTLPLLQFALVSADQWTGRTTSMPSASRAIATTSWRMLAGWTGPNGAKSVRKFKTFEDAVRPPTSERAEGVRRTPCFRADSRSFHSRGRARRAFPSKPGCACSNRLWFGIPRSHALLSARAILLREVLIRPSATTSGDRACARTPFSE